jgi:hypothetical protein
MATLTSQSGTYMTTLSARNQLLRIITVGAFAVVLTASECPLDDNTPGNGNGNGGDTPTPTTIVAAGGGGQTATVGTALANELVVQVDDQSGNPMAGVEVTYAVSSSSGSVMAGAAAALSESFDGGSVTPSSTSTGSDGRATTVWTLGTTAGDQEVTASVTGIGTSAVFTATATADVAVSVTLVSGDAQSGFPNTPLSNPIVVKVADQYDNGVDGEAVDFSVLSGGGSITASDTTGTDGNAQATWTLGPAVGANTAQASATGLTGSPIALSATASTLTVTGVSPDPLVEGASATITGTGFNLTPGNNSVMVDGRAATVTSVANEFSMNITVPTFDCRPERLVDVMVSVGAFNDTYADHKLEPMSAQLALSVGEQTIIDDPADFCLQFAASAVPNEEYLIGVGASAEVPSQVVPFMMTSVAGVSSAPPAMVPRPSRSAATRPPAFDAELSALRERQATREAEIRAYERRALDPANNPGIRYLSGRPMSDNPLAAAAMAPTDTLGHQRQFRVPGSSCSEFTEITATVQKVGSKGIWYTDDANPTGDPLTQGDIDSASTLFDDFIYPFATAFFDVPSDIDNNSKIIIVLTKEVNAMDAAGFVYSGDLVDRSSCAYSDEGEIFYGYVPDGTYTRQSVVNFLPVLIAHEFTHNIQISRRTVLLSGGTFPASWIAEGQATFAEEVVGHAYTGNSAGNNYDGSVARAGPPYWYWQGLTKLGYYFGGNGGTKVANAPEDCTLFGNFSGNIGVCDQSSFYGASWSMLRYLTDRFYSADPSAFHKDIISANPGMLGVANVEAVTQMNFDTLFAQWGAMLYMDDWSPGVPAELSMTSWDLPHVLSEVAATAGLEPADRAFGAFSDSRSVRGGSHAYTIVSAAGSRPALAIRVRDGGDDVLASTGMTPILWIVRVQ